MRDLKSSWSIILMVVLSVLCFLIASSALNQPLLTWDDTEQIPENIQVTTFTIQKIPVIFTSFYTAMYQPLATLSFALEYKIFGLAPWVFRLDNLLLHCLNGALVFWLTFLLWRKRSTALIAAAFFMLWPTQVEAYTWISARSTLLVATFSLASLVAYYHYLTTCYKRYWLITFTFFILAVLTKASAVALPLLFLIADYWWQRPDKKKLFLEKIPFLIISVAIGFVAVLARQSVGTTTFSIYADLEKLGLIAYAYLWQLKLLVWPFNLSPFYTHPTSTVFLPWNVWLSLILFPLFGLLLYLKKQPWILFVTAWFTASIIFSIQLAPYITTLGADRYNYLALLAFVWPLAWWLSQPTKALKFKLIYFLIIVVVLFTASWSYAPTWSSEINLWQQASKTKLDDSLIIGRLAGALYTSKDCPDAYALALTSVALDSRYVENYNLLGIIEMQCLGHYQFAANNFIRAVNLEPEVSLYHYNLGLAYAYLKKYPLATTAYTNALRLNKKEAKDYQVVYCGSLQKLPDLDKKILQLWCQ